MLLSISTNHPQAIYLGYLLHKHPDKYQVFDFAYGKIHVFYPEYQEKKCTVALLLDINPIDLVKTNKTSHNFVLKQYVNDRPYVASSLMSVAISRVFSTALNGRCKAYPQAIEQKMPFEAKIAALPARGEEELLDKLFAPLGYKTTMKRLPLDKKFPEWGDSEYFSVILEHKALTLKDLLRHLYVLIPVLDNEKHYWVDKDEVEKLLAKGELWLGQHPHKKLIISRYLKYQKSLFYQAFERLTAEEGLIEKEQKESTLHQIRLQKVTEELKKIGAKKVLDLGCGEGKLLELLLAQKTIEKILAVDVSYKVLEIAKKRLFIEDMAPKQRERIELIHGALTYRDKRLEGFDAAAIVEVIEHLDLPRLKAIVKVVFEFAKPRTIIITTPNSEYNIVFAKKDVKKKSKFRHPDHRFEWTRKQFKEWSERLAAKYNYKFVFANIGPEHQEHGAPGQMGVFTK